MKNIFIYFSVVVFYSTQACAVVPLWPEKKDHKKNAIDRMLDGLGASGDYDPSKKIDFSVLPGPFYTPEMEFGIGVSAVGLYHAASDTSHEQPSSVTINGFASSNFSAGITVHNITFLNNGEHRLELLAEISKAPDVYYGSGYDAGKKDSNKIDFTHEIFQFSPKYYYKLRPNLFVGVGFDYQKVQASSAEFNNVGVGMPEILDDNEALGLVVNLTYDSRDYVLNPYTGWLFQVDMAQYFEALSDENFTTYNAVLSNYIDLEPVPGVLAWQVKGAFTNGDVPWNYLPEVGGADNLRGYIEGRYRDNQILYTQVEYRLPLYGRTGMVTWVGAASSGEQVNQIGKDVLMSYGVGYRFRVKDRVNLRLDYAIGEDESMVYFNVNEAF
ncbi:MULTISPECIES: BamA/TamA family outer membrane protein [Vibrio]|uniref:BamA/TamA family outer membrane protein n=1 Tax=Vibrio algicola TaxID=2662262 RepID=A0A5Q0TDN8_9VIBR|nr:MULTISPECIES: BamA/TamA family outer membrane protein [Vibrio]MBD1575516.1 BamA/TamA family outer membrane protein [Vibrio sp. S11_S32]